MKKSYRIKLDDNSLARLSDQSFLYASEGEHGYVINLNSEVIITCDTEKESEDLIDQIEGLLMNCGLLIDLSSDAPSLGIQIS